MLCFFSCDTTDDESTSNIKQEDTSQFSVEPSIEPSVEPTDELIEPSVEQPSSEVYRSNLIDIKSHYFEYNRQVTAGNPLQGFATSYGWGSPNNLFPHSLEFRYIPLSDLLQSPNTYSFETGLEPYLEEAVTRGNQVILRVYIDYPALEYGLPEYLQGDVPCENYTDHGGGCSPDYSNSTLQNAIVDFIAMFGTTYDGDNRLAFVQVGLLGFWGEWHTYPHTELFADDVFQQQVISTFDTAFDITPIQLRIPAQDSPQRDIGFHDDSFIYSTLGDIAWFFWPKMIAAGADSRWEIAPMGGEVYPPLQQSLFDPTYIVDTYQQDFQQTITTTHMTYLLNYQAFNMNGTGYTGSQFQAAEDGALALGYEFTVEQVDVELAGLEAEHVDLQIAIHLRNSGIAPFYYPLQLSLYSSESGISVPPHAGIEDMLPSTQNTEVVFSLQDVPISELILGYEMALETEYILDGHHILWANTEQILGKITIDVAQECSFDGGQYILGQVIQMHEKQCYCDVDGLFYDIENELCF